MTGFDILVLLIVAVAAAGGFMRGFETAPSDPGYSQAWWLEGSSRAGRGQKVTLKDPGTLELDPGDSEDRFLLFMSSLSFFVKT